MLKFYTELWTLIFFKQEPHTKIKEFLSLATTGRNANTHYKSVLICKMYQQFSMTRQLPNKVKMFINDARCICTKRSGIKLRSYSHTVTDNLICIGSHSFAMFHTHALREWVWPHAAINVTTITCFVKNCTVGLLSLCGLFYACAYTVATLPGPIDSFAALYTEMLAGSI